jgi:hypothetical protein
LGGWRGGWGWGWLEIAYLIPQETISR